MNQAKLMALVAEYTANKIVAEKLKPMDDGPIADAMRGLVVTSRLKLDDAMQALFDAVESTCETGVGVAIGVNDANGNPVHIGDTLEFDYGEWWRTANVIPDGRVGQPVLTVVELRQGEIVCKGGVGSIQAGWLKVVKGWDEA